MTLPSFRDAQEVYEIRAALEALAARRFVEHADASQRALLRAAFDELERATTAGGDTVALLTAKDGFYEVLIDGRRTARCVRCSPGCTLASAPSAGGS